MTILKWDALFSKQKKRFVKLKKYIIYKIKSKYSPLFLQPLEKLIILLYSSWKKHFLNSFLVIVVFVFYAKFLSYFWFKLHLKTILYYFKSYTEIYNVPIKYFFIYRNCQKVEMVTEIIYFIGLVMMIDFFYIISL